MTIEDFKKLNRPKKGSHKGQNGRLLLIGGSKLFHAASLWSLTVASRIVDLVHYASVPENNEIVLQAKKEFRNGIVIPRDQIEEYIEEDDVILIGPGMTRADSASMTNTQYTISNVEDILKIQDEGVQTGVLVNYLLKKYPKKQWVIDAGALQMMDVALIPPGAILTPHHGEFLSLITRAEIDTADTTALRSQKNFDPSSVSRSSVHGLNGNEKVNPDKIFSLPAKHEIDTIRWFAKTHECIVLLKGEKDIACEGGSCSGKVCTPLDCRVITGGNEGMTKGGTGDVLAGLIAALACTNDPFLSTIAGSYINKAAGDALYKSVGPYFNASDLASQIPKTMNLLLNS